MNIKNDIKTLITIGVIFFVIYSVGLLVYSSITYFFSSFF